MVKSPNLAELNSGKGAAVEMDFIAGLALVLLALVGYSSGTVLAAKGRSAVPGISDLVVSVALSMAALATRGTIGKWGAIGIWALVGLALGAILAQARPGHNPKAEPLKRGTGLWNAWKDFARQMGNYQSRLLMAFMYFSLVLPFGLGVSLLSDPLKIKGAHNETNWQSKMLPFKPSVEEARSQF